MAYEMRISGLSSDVCSSDLQTLVKDVITGLFYLVEDAFRKGEYIQCSGGKGVVEKISLRSVQLRHHNGPLNTIPFGEMGNITNHSRDWVREIGRASSRERVCKYGWISVVAVPLKKKQKK